MPVPRTEQSAARGIEAVHKRQVQVHLVLARRMLGVDQRGFENFDNLVPGQLSPVELDQHRARERVGLERVDPQHADQFALDCLTQFFLAVQDRVFQPQPSRQLVFDFPVGDDRAVAEVSDLALAITGRRDRGDGHSRVFHGGAGMIRTAP